ncbi:MAG: hypothetical protein JWQ35_982 [Bacteriovoracaceae bacterium]|nr:hypothetical protein [Bacteriovoracaceae bacterium]
MNIFFFNKRFKSYRFVLLFTLLVPFANSFGQETSTLSDVSHEWDGYCGGNVTEGRAYLLIPPAETIKAERDELLQQARRDYFIKYFADDDAFFDAVRGGKIYLITGKQQEISPEPKSEDSQKFAIEENGLSDPTKHRYEMIVVEDLIESTDVDGKKEKRTIRSLAIKYAPKEDFLDANDLEKKGIRVLFYNVPHPINDQNERINPDGAGPDIYHSRINRNVLAFDMDGNRILKGQYFQKPAFFKNGIPNSLWFKTYLKAKYVPATTTSAKVAVVAAILNAAIPLIAFKVFGNPEHSYILLASLATGLNVFVLTTWDKTYTNIVRSKSITKETLARVLIDLPFSLALAYSNHADFALTSTYVRLLSLSVVDKVNAVFSYFIPLLREEKGITKGKRVFGMPKAQIEKNTARWFRQLGRQLATTRDTFPGVKAPYIGELLFFLSGIPFYFYDIAYAKKHAKEFPKMAEDAKRLKEWANPKNYFNVGIKTTKNVCSNILRSVGSLSIF